MNTTDIDQQVEGADEAGRSGALRRGIAGALIIGALTLIGVVGLLALRNRGGATPAPGSADLGFARDMIVHHAQAVNMAQLLYDRTQNPTLRIIALDMMLTQQAQVGQMQGWLYLWEQPIAGVGPAMAWMDMPTSGLMPGMATDEQLAALRAATGIEADRRFIELMIPHHQSGIHMAQAILTRTSIKAVQDLARSIIDAQQREIVELQKLQAELGS
jgi:uncharacterized protein (DUF305 family)